VGAGNVLSDFRKKHSGQMDQALWNAFITAAGRASQMGRAVETLEEMQVIPTPLHGFYRASSLLENGSVPD
jgi:pentatricopeptide repeat protein